MKKLWLNKSEKSLMASKAATKTIPTTTTNVASVTTTTGSSSTPAAHLKAAITSTAILPLKPSRSPPVATVPLKATITSPIASIPLKAAIVIKNVTPTYIQRKSMQPMFQELFAALFKIPDKALHQRVLDAINGDPCRRCKERAARLYSDADCQTEAKEKYNDAETQTEVISSTIAEELGLQLMTEPPNVPKRRKRKRKLCLPRVVKQSHAEQLREHQKSYSAQPTKRKKIAVVEPKLEPPATPPPLDMEDSKEDSWSLNNFPFLDDVLALPDFVEEDQNKTSQLDYVINTMLKEFLMAERYENGLLPIHDAIISNNTMQLQRQIYVWGKKNCDLNELLTETGDDCLQLAVINDCLPEIYEILLNKQLNINVIDDQSNNIIHLAMSSEICLESLEILLKKIDPQLLLQHNDDGYTPLHIAVRQDLYQHAELLLNMLDKRLSNKLIYPRQQSDDCKREEFCYYYEHACSELGVGGQSHKPSPLKMKLLNAGDMRGGNTALFYCVENKLDHMAFLLLAHLADPGILNYSSQSAKIYFNDFGKLFELSLKVDNAMDKVIELLSDLV